MPKRSATLSAELREQVLESRTAGRRVARAATAVPTTEHSAEQILEACASRGAPTGGTRAEASAGTHGPDRIVLFMFFGVRQHRIGLGDVLELFLRGSITGVLVRVILTGCLR